jgi:hypothetical protein
VLLGGARVIQVGGGTKELYYYPNDATLIINIGENINPGLMQQGGVQAGVPTEARKQSPTNLLFQVGNRCLCSAFCF